MCSYSKQGNRLERPIRRPRVPDRDLARQTLPGASMSKDPTPDLLVVFGTRRSCFSPDGVAPRGALEAGGP